MGVAEQMVAQEGIELQEDEKLLSSSSMVEISAKTPERAFELFQKALDQYPDKIVFLSKETST